MLGPGLTKRLASFRALVSPLCAMKGLDEEPFIHSLTHSFNKYVQCPPYTRPVLGTGVDCDKTDEVTLAELNILVGIGVINK